MSPTWHKSSGDSAPLARFGGALGLAALLVVFLAGMRLLDARRIPDQTVRSIETVEELAPPPPPPPVNLETPPPPPPPVSLPKLDVQIEQVAPALSATLDSRIDLTMRHSDFELEADPSPSEVRPPKPRTRPPTNTPPAPRVRPSAPPRQTTYSAGELDGKPRLLNRPSASYPPEMLRRGVREGRVLLEVAISNSGRVSVRRVLSSSHPEFTKMARSFASRARFSVPRKDGRPVTAIYRWPLTLRP